MRRCLAGFVLICALAWAALLWLAEAAKAAENAAVGTWKVVLHLPDADITLFLVKVIREEDKSLRSTVIARGVSSIKAASIDRTALQEGRLHFQLKINDNALTMIGYLPKGDESPKRFFGILQEGEGMQRLSFDRTAMQELDPAKGVERTKVHDALIAAFRSEDVKKQEELFKDFLAKNAEHPGAYFAAMALVDHAGQHHALEADARSRAETALKLAVPYGREIELTTAREIVEMLSASEKLTAVAVDFGRRAEKLLAATDSPQTQYDTLKPLAAALRKAKRTEEAQAVEARLAQLDRLLDEEYHKKVPPFKTELFRGRTAKSDRVVVVELFTGAQCPPCVAADVAFDGALKTYKPTDVVFLQYHLHVPGPDPLTVPISEQRAEKHYAVLGTPAVRINGSTDLPLGGLMQHAEDRYARLRKAIEEKLETAAEGKLTLKVERRGDNLEVQAEVSALTKSGDDVRLRFFLVEESIRYLGTNNIRFHHNVVRAMPGGLEGFPLKEKAGKHTATINLADLRKEISDYLNKYAAERSFPNDTRPLDLQGLKVIAIIQEDKEKEILQAAQVDVPK